ncbi:unnamed protein product [Oikopleura dioica]|uniref:Uncharacterized protein n=1 Tax=Oikopleura dioica TaxID=34765 RepID=E4YH11_OIKDI|nr:unnamed protein product [Oikopleura dioica]
MSSDDWTIVTRRSRLAANASPEPQKELLTRNSFESLTDSSGTESVLNETPETKRGPPVEMEENDPTSLHGTPPPEATDAPRAKSATKTLAQRVLRLFGRSGEDLQQRPERIQFKVSKKSTSKSQKKSQKFKKGRNVLTKKNSRVTRASMKNAPPQSDLQTDLPAPASSDSSSDFDEEITAPCPTIDELQAAEVTITGHSRPVNDNLAAVFGPKEPDSTLPSPFSAIKDHGFGSYATILNDIDMEQEHTEPGDGGVDTQFRVFHGLTEFFQGCIFPQLQLHFQDQSSDSSKVQLALFTLMAGYLSIIMPKRSLSFTSMFQYCTCILTGAESHSHFRLQRERATRGVLDVFSRLLDVNSLKCHVEINDDDLTTATQELLDSMTALLPDQTVLKQSFENELRADLMLIDTELVVNAHLRQVILSSLYVCDALGNKDAELGPAVSYRYRVLKALPFHALQVLMNMEILKCDDRLTLHPSEVKEEFFLPYLEEVVKLRSDEPASQQSDVRYPIPAFNHFKPLAKQIIQERQRQRLSSSANIEQPEDPTGSGIEVEESSINGSDHPESDSASYFVQFDGPTVRVFGMVEVDPRLLIHRLTQSRLDDHFPAQESDQTDHLANREDQPSPARASPTTETTENQVHNGDDLLPKTLPNDSIIPHGTRGAVQRKRQNSGADHEQFSKHPRLRASPITAPTSNTSHMQSRPIEEPICSTDAGSSTTNQTIPETSLVEAMKSTSLTPVSSTTLPPLCELGPAESEPAPDTPQTDEVMIVVSGDEVVPLRNILSNAVGDSRRSVRSWGPSSKPTLLLRTSHTREKERDPERVKLTMELLASKNLFLAVHHREPSDKEIDDSILSSFQKYIQGQVMSKFSDAELTRAHRELETAEQSPENQLAFYDLWLPKLLEIEEYVQTPVLRLGLFQSGYFQDHHSLKRPLNDNELSNDSTVFGRVRGSPALAALKKVVNHLILDHPKVQLQTEVCNTIALRSRTQAWCQSIPTKDQPSRATAVFPACHSLSCLTTGGCLFRSSTIIVGLYDDPCLDLLAVSQRLQHCAATGELRMLTESMENDKELCELVQSRLPFLSTVLSGNSYLAPRHPNLEPAGEVAAVTICGTERTFDHSGTYLNLNFAPETQDINSPHYNDYLRRYALLRICLQQFGFTVIDHPASGNMKVELSSLTPPVANTFYQYVGLLTRGSPTLTTIPDNTLAAQIKLRPSSPTQKIPSLFSTSGSAPEAITRGYISRHRYTHFPSTFLTEFSKRGPENLLWKRFVDVQLAVYRKGPYAPGTSEASVLSEVQIRLARMPNPFRRCLDIADRQSKLTELNVVLHNNEEELNYFLKHVFTPDVCGQTRQLCPVPYCCSTTCSDNVDGFSRFQAELDDYRHSELSEDTAKVPRHWKDVFTAEAGKVVHLAEAACRLIDQGRHRPVSTGLESLATCLRSPPVILSLQENDWSYNDMLRMGVTFMHVVSGLYRRPSKSGGTRKPDTKYLPMCAAFYFSNRRSQYFISLKEIIPTRLSRNYMKLLN